MGSSIALVLFKERQQRSKCTCKVDSLRRVFRSEEIDERTNLLIYDHQAREVFVSGAAKATTILHVATSPFLQVREFIDPPGVDCPSSVPRDT